MDNDKALEIKQIRSRLNEKAYNELMEDLNYANEVVFKDYFAAPEAPKFSHTVIQYSDTPKVPQVGKFMTNKTYQQFQMDDKFAESLSHHLKKKPDGLSNIERYIEEAKLKEFEDVFGVSFEDYSKQINGSIMLKKDKYGNSDFYPLEKPELRLSKIETSKQDNFEVETRIKKIAHTKVAIQNPADANIAWEMIESVTNEIEKNPKKFLEKDVKIDPNVHDIELILTNKQAFSNAINAVNEYYSRLSLSGPPFTEKSFSETMNDPYRVRTIIDYFDKEEGKLSKFEQLQKRVEDLESRKALAVKNSFQVPSMEEMENKIDAIRNKSLSQPANDPNRPKYA